MDKQIENPKPPPHPHDRLVEEPGAVELQAQLEQQEHHSRRQIDSVEASLVARNFKLASENRELRDQMTPEASLLAKP